jgi:RNase P/RNase MRP subunit p29
MLIGKTITIKNAKNKSLNAKKGLVIDETKNTITMRSNARTLTIIKDQLITIEEA